MDSRPRHPGDLRNTAHASVAKRLRIRRQTQPPGTLIQQCQKLFILPPQYIITQFCNHLHQYSTEQTIVQVIMNKLLSPESIILDPACGAGDLLIAASEHLPVWSGLDTTLEFWAIICMDVIFIRNSFGPRKSG